MYLIPRVLVSSENQPVPAVREHMALQQKRGEEAEEKILGHVAGCPFKNCLTPASELQHPGVAGSQGH